MQADAAMQYRNATRTRRAAEWIRGGWNTWESWRSLSILQFQTRVSGSSGREVVSGRHSTGTIKLFATGLFIE
jgi:hypothetical protein